MSDDLEKQRPGEEPAPPGYAPIRDSQLFPRLERFLRIAWVVLGAAVLAAGYFVLVRPRLQKPPEEVAATRLGSATRLTSEFGLAIDPAFSPDGKFLAYAASSGDRGLGIYIHPLSGGQPVRLSSGQANESAPDFSPDGGQVVYQSDEGGGGIFIATRDRNEPPKRVAANGRRPRFSPDGKWVAYSTSPGAREGSSALGPSELYVVSAQGGEPRSLQPAFLQAQAPVWHGDGKHLLFDGTSERGQSDWWVTPVGEGVAVRTGAAERLRAALRLWSTPDRWQGDKVFFSGGPGDDLDLYEISISQANWRAAGPPSRLTTGTDRQSLVAVGPGGRIAYVTSKSWVGVWSAPIQPEAGKVLGNLQRIGEADAVNRLPSVSADGKRFIYVSNRLGSQDIWLSDAGLETGRTLVSLKPVSYRPVVSADGNHLAFMLAQSGQCVLQVVDLRTTQVEFRQDTCIGLWDIAPDGRGILFFNSAPDAVQRTVELMEIPSGRRTQIVAHPSLRTYAGRFSADGRWIAFAAGSSVADAKLFIAPFRGGAIKPSEWIAITEEKASMPTWSPGGGLLYFRSRRDNFDCIWAQKLDAQKRPSEPATGVLHFHRVDTGLFRLGDADFAMSVTRDGLVLSLASHSGAVWLARIRN